MCITRTMRTYCKVSTIAGALGPGCKMSTTTQHPARQTSTHTKQSKLSSSRSLMQSVDNGWQDWLLTLHALVQSTPLSHTPHKRTATQSPSIVGPAAWHAWPTCSSGHIAFERTAVLQPPFERQARKPPTHQHSSHTCSAAVAATA